MDRSRIYMALLVAWVIPFQAHTQQADWSKYEVIIYDAATIARINQPVKHITSEGITDTTIADETSALETVTSESVSLKPRDLSPYITKYNSKGVPIMVDPPACEENSLAVRFKVTNIKKIRGHIVADLHGEKPDHFLEDDKVISRVRVKVNDPEQSFCFPLTTPGNYAVAFYHDKNDNEKFDKGFLKIPKERFGMSRNPKFGLEAPKLEQAIFNVPETGVDMTIRLRSSGDILGGQ